jgi:putative Ca2+/H+ antiporter (TMEM165/GDT1 family)
MALSALLGITTMIAFVTIGWPGDSGRVVIGIFIGAVVGFMTCASIAVFSAARDTYPRRTGEQG